MKLGVPSETVEGERRVALTPDGVKTLKSKGFDVMIESGAGARAGFADDAYHQAGAEIVSGDRVYEHADIVLKVQGPQDGSPLSEVNRLRSGSMIVSFLFPTTNLDTTRQLAARNVTAFAMDLVPRITRAQSMDALSSMSTVAGYQAALIAASLLPRFFPMLTTAAGTIPPAKVLVIGAGVAGLQAIAVCKRLGAIVEAFDVRAAVKEQVESLGARFVSMPHLTEDAEDASGYAKEVSSDTHVKELELIASRLPKNDVVITTALIPGKPAPVLITREMVKLMSPGSVIVDLAAPNGGNCEATVPGQTVLVDGVQIAGPTDILSTMAADASRMYSRNLVEFLSLLAPQGTLKLDMEDQILRETLVTHEGKVVHEPTRLALERQATV